MFLKFFKYPILNFKLINYTIKEMAWMIVDVTDSTGQSASELQVNAFLRLAEDSYGAVECQDNGAI